MIRTNTVLLAAMAAAIYSAGVAVAHISDGWNDVRPIFGDSEVYYIVPPEPPLSRLQMHNPCFDEATFTVEASCRHQ